MKQKEFRVTGAQRELKKAGSDKNWWDHGGYWAAMEFEFYFTGYGKISEVLFITEACPLCVTAL